MRKALLFFACVSALQVHADTVVGIHGFITDWRSMIPIERVVGPLGLNSYLWNYPSRNKFIEQHACDLILTLQEIAQSCPGRPIHFVTHSTGGLILRVALNLPECPIEAKIGRAILLAPPNQGSAFARRFKNFAPIEVAMGKKTGRQLLHYGPYEMAQLGVFPNNMDVLVIAGTAGGRIWIKEPNDGFLTVRETWLNTPFYFQSYPVEHGYLMRSRAVRCCIKKFIQDWYRDPKPACADLESCYEAI